MISVSEKEIKLQNQSIGLDLDEALNRNLKVLIVDDDPDTVELMKRVLRLANFDVASAKNGIDAISITGKINPDVILLDLMMPDVDGKETLMRLRGISVAPVIVVSALSGKDNVIELLNLGSDDYVAKPFHREELVARIHAVLRRAKTLSIIDGVSIPEIDLFINFSRQEIHYKGQFIPFSPKEYDLLELCVKNMPHNVSYKELSESLWSEYTQSSKNRIKYLVHAIRKKFYQVYPEIDVIINSKRFGYRIQTN